MIWLKLSSIHQNKIEASFAGIQKTYLFSPVPNQDSDFFKQLFRPSLISLPVGAPHAEQLKSGLEKMKLLSVANTTEILQALGLVVAMPVTSAQLTVLLEQVDWTTVTGVTKTMLQNEISELKAWETLN